MIGPKINYRAKILMKSIPAKPFMAAELAVNGPALIRLERLGLIRRKEVLERPGGKGPVVKWELTGEGRDWREKYGNANKVEV